MMLQRQIRDWVLGAALLACCAHGIAQQPQGQLPAQAIAGYWTTDARFSSRIASKTQPDYFWVGRMWGRIDATGKMRFDADNGCVATGLLQPYIGANNWTGIANVEGCKSAAVNGRYTISASGGATAQANLSLGLSSQRMVPGVIATDVYEAAGTFTRYRP